MKRSFKKYFIILLVINLVLQICPINLGTATSYASTINGIELNNTIVTYDGQYHSVYIGTIPAGYTFYYTYSDEVTGVLKTSSTNPSFKTIGKHSVSISIKYNTNTLACSQYVQINSNSTVSISSALPDGLTAVKLKWTTDINAYGYEIQYSTDSSLLNPSIKTITNQSTNSISIDGLKYDTYYYFKIISYKLSNGSKVYSSYSNIAYATTNSIDYMTPKLEITNITYNTISLAWTEVKGATGYAIYKYLMNTDGTYSQILLANYTNGTTVNVTCNTGESYTFAIKPYITIGEQIYYGNISNEVTGDPTLRSPYINDINTLSSSEILFSWDKVDGANGYNIYCCTSENGTYEKIGTLSDVDLSSRVSNLADGTTYYFVIQAYTVVNGENVYSNFSNIKFATTLSAIVTPAPTTPAPTTPATQVPATSAPATLVPATPAPTNAAPATPAPTNVAPATPAPTNATPATLVPATSPPATPEYYSDNDDNDDNDDPDLTNTDTDEEADDLPAVGEAYKIGNLIYKVTTSDSVHGTVTVVKPTKKTFTKMTIPSTVEINDYDFKVTGISQNAFKLCKKLKVVKLSQNIKTINKNAFYGCKNLKTLTIKSVVMKNIRKGAISGINTSAIINVPNKKLTYFKKLFRTSSGYKKTMKIV